MAAAQANQTSREETNRLESLIGKNIGFGAYMLKFDGTSSGASLHDLQPELANFFREKRLYFDPNGCGAQESNQLKNLRLRTTCRVQGQVLVSGLAHTAREFMVDVLNHLESPKRKKQWYLYK